MRAAVPVPVPVPEKLSEEAQKPEGAVGAAGQSQEKRPDKAPETVEPSGAAGQLQEKPPGEASKTEKASGAAGGVQPLTGAYLSHAAPIGTLPEEAIRMFLYEIQKNQPSQSPPTSPKDFKF